MIPPATTLLKSLVRFPSLSRNEGPIASFLVAYLEHYGLRVHRIANNVYGTLGDGKHRLLLNSHLDVVPASAGHLYDAFDPVERDGAIFGRGTADAKASGAAMVTALLNLAREGWRPAGGQIIVALTACEETGAEDNGLRRLRPFLPKLHAALVGEPTSLVPVVAQKGLLVLRITAYGQSAHAARPQLGQNAITQAAEDIRRLQSFSFEHTDRLLGAPTLCVTRIDGGTKRNVVPDRCTFYVDVRSVPGLSHADMVARLSVCLQSEVAVHSDRIIPVSTPVTSRIVTCCLEALPGARPEGSPTASDWIHLHDLPVVKIGPGQSAHSHTAREQVDAEEVLKAERVYRRIIRTYFARKNKNP